MAESPARQSGWNELREVVVPALTFVLGCQAWRAAVVLLQDGWLWRLLLALALLILPLAQAVAHWVGVRRTAVGLSLGLGALRLIVQIAGPETVPWFAILGTAAFAAYLDLWAAQRGPTGAALQAVLLGVSLQLLDRLLTDTYDLYWRTGGGILVSCVLLTMPVLLAALLALPGRGGGPPQQTPLTLGMPLVVVAVQMGFSHPALARYLTGWSLPLTLFLLAVASTTGAIVGGLYDRLHAGLLARRPKQRFGRRLYFWLATALVVAATAGTLWPALRTTMLLLGPTALAVVLVPLLRARPIGRRRRVGSWSSVAAWGLALALSGIGGAALWPAGLALVVLAQLSAVAVFHQERPDPTQELRPPLYPLAGHGALLLLALLMLLRGAAPSVDLEAEMSQGAIRVATCDLSTRVAAGERPALNELLAPLRSMRTRLVLLRDPGGGTAQFQDTGFWLARHLGLSAYRLPGGQLELLAAARPARLERVGPRAMISAWQFDESGLAIACLADSTRPGDDLTAALAAIGDFPRRLICGSVNPAVSPGGAPPGYLRARHVAAVGGDDALLLSRGIQSVRTPPPAPLPVPGLTALLEIEP